MSAEKACPSPHGPGVTAAEVNLPTHRGTSEFPLGSQRKRMGYPDLAHFMTESDSMAIFRRFGSLNVVNLLYLQAELTWLEAELRNFVTMGKQSGDPEQALFHVSWKNLREGNPSSASSLQWKKVLEIREVLDRYNTSLLHQTELYKLNAPTTHNLETLKRWLQSEQYGNFFLRGVEGDVWYGPHVDDLVAVSSKHGERDLFSAWLGDTLVGLYHRRWGHKKTTTADAEAGYVKYDDSKLARWGNILTTMIAATLPTVAIFVLYFVRSMTARLGVVLGFSVLFSACLAVFTRAKKIEIFAATAAFASVQVVFVGSTK